VIGITVAMGAQLYPTLLLAAHLKSLRPTARIVLGGPAISLMDQTDLNILLQHHRAIDCAVKFDGEYPLLQLVQQALADEWNPVSVPGVSCLGGEGSKIVIHIPPAPGPDVNQLPAPLYPYASLARLAKQSPYLPLLRAG